jgi:hypothetical protein
MVNEDHEYSNEAGQQAWAVCGEGRRIRTQSQGGLALRRMTPPQYEHSSFREGRGSSARKLYVKFDLDLKGVVQIERKSGDLHTEGRMVDFLKKFPPETLDLKFRSYGAEEETAKLMKEVGIKAADADNPVSGEFLFRIPEDFRPATILRRAIWSFLSSTSTPSSGCSPRVEHLVDR